MRKMRINREYDYVIARRLGGEFRFPDSGQCAYSEKNGVVGKFK